VAKQTRAAVAGSTSLPRQGAPVQAAQQPARAPVMPPPSISVEAKPGGVRWRQWQSREDSECSNGNSDEPSEFHELS
jgi:hypothetical protein